MFATKNSSS